MIVGGGLVAVALLAGRGITGSHAAADTEVPPVAVEVHGSVAADGTLTSSSPGVIAGHPTDGRYLVVVEGNRHLSVTSWDRVAEVRVTPVGAGVSVIAFEGAAGVPVDTSFTFVVSGPGLTSTPRTAPPPR